MERGDSHDGATEGTAIAGLSSAVYDVVLRWSPQAPRFKASRLLVSWLVAAVSVLIAAAIVPGVSVGNFGAAAGAAAMIAVLNAVLPPPVAALRMPFALALGFVVVVGDGASRGHTPELE